jgi:hypothetical protein
MSQSLHIQQDIVYKILIAKPGKKKQICMKMAQMIKKWGQRIVYRVVSNVTSKYNGC